MIYEAQDYSRLEYNHNNTQKDILPKFGLTFKPRTGEYVLNDEYNILFINTRDDNWSNSLSIDGLTLYEYHNKDNLDKLRITNNRLKKRITFLHYFSNKSNANQGYSFIGVFELDKNYDYTKDIYPKSGKPVRPRLKYNRISSVI